MYMPADDQMQGETAEVQLAQRTRGIASGTVVATLDGYLPVDFLSTGDRVVTRAGMRILRKIAVERFSGQTVRIGASALGHDRPEQDLTLPADTLILLRDWRAQAIYGQDQALVPVERLVDGEYVLREDVLGMRLYELIFDTPQIVYAEGVEIYCNGLPAVEEAPKTKVEAGSEAVSQP
jgi:hypothetical protein